jgi:hypothetical protein
MSKQRGLDSTPAVLRQCRCAVQLRDTVLESQACAAGERAAAPGKVALEAWRHNRVSEHAVERFPRDRRVMARRAIVESGLMNPVATMSSHAPDSSSVARLMASAGIC